MEDIKFKIENPDCPEIPKDVINPHLIKCRLKKAIINEFKLMFLE
jgi:hypothetical protein